MKKIRFSDLVWNIINIHNIVLAFAILKIDLIFLQLHVIIIDRALLSFSSYHMDRKLGQQRFSGKRSVQ